MRKTDYYEFELKEFKLQNTKHNVVIYPTYFVGRHTEDNERLIGKSKL